MYTVERWTYTKGMKQRRVVINTFSKCNEMIAIIDHSKNGGDAFLIVSVGQNPEKDMRQARALEKFINSDEFPKD